MKNDAMKSILKGLREQMLKAMVAKHKGMSEESSKEEEPNEPVEASKKDIVEDIAEEPADMIEQMLMGDLEKIKDRKAAKDGEKGFVRAGVLNITAIPGNPKKKGK